MKSYLAKPSRENKPSNKLVDRIDWFFIFLNLVLINQLSCSECLLIIVVQSCTFSFCRESKSHLELFRWQ
jgi:hypothetical protein